MVLYKIIRKVNDPLVRLCVAEFFGTFFLVLTVALALRFYNEAAPLFIGFAITALVFGFGFISGAQLNPVISLGVYFVGGQPLTDLIALVFTHTVASVAGGCLTVYIGGEVANTTNVVAPVAATSEISSLFRALVGEWVFTTFLLMIYLNVAVSRQRENHFFGAAIGLSYVAAGVMFRISGATHNPAIATGLHVTNCIFGDCGRIAELWVYWVAGLLAAFVGSLLFLLLNENPQEVVYQRLREEQYHLDSANNSIKTRQMTNAQRASVSAYSSP